MDILKKIGSGFVVPDPVIKITDPVLFNVCLAACSEGDEAQLFLQYMHIDVAHKRLIGSNGHMLVSADAIDFCEWPNAKDLLIKPEWPLPDSAHLVKINLSTKLITGYAIEGEGLPFSIPYSTIDIKYPDVSALLDRIVDENRAAADRISLNSTYLYRLQRATNMMSSFPTLIPYRFQGSDSCHEYITYAIDLNCHFITNNYTAIIMPILS